jgi:B12-binding domain/radical SAM domain protein
MHARSGVVGLNVVTAALDVDARTRGVDVRFAKDVPSMIEALRDVASSGARAISAWSFYSPDADAATRDLAAVKEATHGLDVLHVAGGVHATAEPLATLRAGFDVAAIGEGERTMIEIVAGASEGRAPRGFAGVAYLDGDGAFVSHGPGERAELDDFPAFNERHEKWNAIEITRGCVYACSFCQTPFMFKARFRHRSVANVKAHVEAMARGGARFVRFVTPTSLSYGSDDTTANLDAVDALLAAVREAAGQERKIYFGTFPSEVRPEHVSERALAILAKWVDNRSLVIGGQSGSDRVLRATKRGHTVEDVVRAVRICVAAGFRPDVDFLLGLPGEDSEDRAASIRLAEELVSMGARIHSHAFMPLPGTPLRDAEPSSIDRDTMLAMARLESRGSAYGQWRRQIVTAESLARSARSRRQGTV